MRWLVWWCVGGLVACGQSAPAPVPGTEAGAAGEDSGGTAGTATASGGSAGLAGGGGVAAGGHSGGAAGGASAGAASGGRSGASGDGSGAAGATSAAGGASGQGGTNAQSGATGDGGQNPIGTAGEGGTPGNECAEYTACGCGCCGGQPSPAKCYYPELGDNLDAIQSEDEAVAASPTCENAGCSLGARYRCCVPTESNDAATYEGSRYIGGIDRVNIARESAVTGRCTRLSLASPPGAGGEQFRIVVPEGWALELVPDYACEDESSAAADSRRYPIGGFGEIRWVTAARCSVDIDVTLFFESETGGVDAVRFDARELVVSSGSPCDPAG